MPVGKNINLKDKLIKKTTRSVSNVSNKSNVSNTRNTNITRKVGMPSPNTKTDTYKTKKMNIKQKPISHKKT